MARLLRRAARASQRAERSLAQGFAAAARRACAGAPFGSSPQLGACARRPHMRACGYHECEGAVCFSTAPCGEPSMLAGHVHVQRYIIISVRVVLR